MTIEPRHWVLGISGLAWVPLVHHAVLHWGHAQHHFLTPPIELLHWGLMVAAMMLPLVTDAITVAAFRSLPERRHRAGAVFVAGFLGCWLLAGLPAVALRQLVIMHDNRVAAICFIAAAAWSVTRVRKKALLRCHRTFPIAPVGFRADLDCFRFGTSVGYGCVVSCGLAMLACTLAGHSLMALVVCMVGGVAERRTFRWSGTPSLIAMAALAVVLTAT